MNSAYLVPKFTLWCAEVATTIINTSQPPPPVSTQGAPHDNTRPTRAQGKTLVLFTQSQGLTQGAHCGNHEARRPTTDDTGCQVKHDGNIHKSTRVDKVCGLMQVPQATLWLIASIQCNRLSIVNPHQVTNITKNKYLLKRLTTQKHKGNMHSCNNAWLLIEVLNYDS